MSGYGFNFAKKYNISLPDALKELSEGTTFRAIEYKLAHQKRLNSLVTVQSKAHNDDEKAKLRAVQAAQRKLEAEEKKREGGYEVWTVKELQALLKSYGLKQTGKKEDYVKRLTDYDLNGPPVEKAVKKARSEKTRPEKAKAAKPEASFEIREFPDYTSTDHDLSNEVMLFLMAAVFQDLSSTLITDVDVENLNDDNAISRMLCKLVTRMRQIKWNDDEVNEGVDEIDNYIHGLPEVSRGKPYIYSEDHQPLVRFARLFYQRGYEMSLPLALKLNEDVSRIERFIEDTIEPIVAEPFSYNHCAAAAEQYDEDDISNSQTSSQINWSIKGPQDEVDDVFQQDDNDMYVSSDSEEEEEPVRISNDDHESDDDSILNSLLSDEVVDATYDDANTAGNFDAGNFDAGNLDAGNFDAGNLDAGNLDAGNLDAGADEVVVDAGADEVVVDADNLDAGADEVVVDALDTGTDIDDLEVDELVYVRKRKRSDKIDDSQKKKRKREKRRREREKRIVQTVIRTLKETMPSFGGMQMPSFGGMQMPFVLMQVPFGQQSGSN